MSDRGGCRDLASMPMIERDWALDEQPGPEPPEHPRREGYGPNVHWRSATEAERAAAWRLVIFLFVFLAIVGALFG